MLKKLASKLQYFAIPNLTWIIVIGSGTFYILGLQNPYILTFLPYVPEKVFHGEFWRVASFLFYPLDMSVFFAIFTYYLFFLMGTALEAEWGDVKFTRYVLLSCLMTLLFGALHQSLDAKNGYIASSIFLAFAYVYPEFELYMFFVIPVKVKYLAIFFWIGFIYVIATAAWPTRLVALAPLVNFFIFFGKSIINRMRAGKHQMESHAQTIRDDKTPFHLCDTCKATENSNPRRDFRVCPICKGGLEYCAEHLKGHSHKS